MPLGICILISCVEVKVPWGQVRESSQVVQNRSIIRVPTVLAYEFPRSSEIYFMIRSSWSSAVFVQTTLPIGSVAL